MQVIAELIDRDFYSVIEDKHGAKAYVYFHDDANHRVVYKDNNGTEFFNEQFKNCSIELVERAAIDWAYGHRKLA